jgi:hypothetical protein
MKKESILRLSLVVLIVLVVLLVWDGCSKNARLSAFKNQIEKFDLGNQKFTEEINDRNERIVTQEQVIMSQKDAIANNLVLIEDLKKIKSQVRIRTIVKIDSVFVPYTDIDTLLVKEPCDFVTRKFALDTKHYSFHGKTKENGVLLDSVSFTNNMKITIGNKRMGFLRKSQPIVSVVNDNPYMSTLSMSNIVIENDLKWYQKRGTWFGIGVGLGFIGALFIP